MKFGFIIDIIIIMVGIAVLTVILTINYKKYMKKGHCNMSFKESLDLTGIPIVTFECEGKKLNFVLDTGSSGSHINSSVLKTIKSKTKCNYTTTVYGMEGNKVNCYYYSLSFRYKNQEFTEEFAETDLDNAFDLVKFENGVTLHGILGSKFLEKYKYILDFKELIAYKNDRKD